MPQGCQMRISCQRAKTCDIERFLQGKGCRENFPVYNFQCIIWKRPFINRCETFEDLPFTFRRVELCPFIPLDMGNFNNSLGPLVKEPEDFVIDIIDFFLLPFDFSHSPPPLPKIMKYLILYPKNLTL